MESRGGARTKVLVVGLDAADPDILRSMADEGRLPTISALLHESACAVTINPEGLFVGAIWPSFATGTSPGRHGRHSPRQIVPGTYIAWEPEATRRPPFWAQLGGVGRRVAIVDVPHSHPIPEAGGIQVSEWGCHDPAGGLATWPTELADDLVGRFGLHPVHPSEHENCDTHGDALDDYVALRDALVGGIAQKTDVVCHLLDQGPWDLFVTVFCESHCANHQCWHLHDPTHDRHDPEIARETGDVLETVYIALDHALATVLEHVDDDTTVLVLASHSAGPHYDASFMFDRILRAVELPELSRYQRVKRRTTAAVWPRLPARAQRRHPHYRDRLWRGFEALAPWTASRRYFKIDNNEPYGGVRVNVVGREPSGRIRPGAEFDECCEQLAQDLLELVNLETGRPLARRVVRTDSLYEGDSLDLLPDLLVEWENEVPVRSVWSPKTGQIDGEYTYVRTGDHRPPGMVLVRGPGIRPGALDAIQTMDLAPTIAAMLGTRLEDCDGRVVEELLERTSA